MSSAQRSWWLGLVLAACAPAWAQDEPPLPPGLQQQEKDEPPLPPGLQQGEDEPALPPGLGEPENPSTRAGAQKESIVDLLGLRGFWEVRGGLRTQRDPYERDASIGESRLQVEAEHALEGIVLRLRSDLVYDAVLGHHTPRLEEGRGFLDLREASVSLSPLDFMDIRAGRQILTWGTGDLLFLNDLFPKDWKSFFIGRDVEYLKAPSDALKLSLFSEVANFDLVYTPRFDPDRFISGERISFFNSALGRRSGRDAVVKSDEPDRWFRDPEWAARLSKNLSGLELALYSYWGFWKSPAGMDPISGKALFPRLAVHGASARTQLAGGIANLEAAYYGSRQDGGGTDPLVENSQVRLLAGYERDLPEVASDLTLGAQYYLEWMVKHGAYARNLPAGQPEKDELRHVITARITKKLLDQNLTLSLFTFYSPSDHDAYLRPKLNYKIDDSWTFEAGANIFFGRERTTFFEQFARNTNVYLALRLSF